MGYQIPNIEPVRIIAGETAEWSRSFPDYPAGTWTLSYRLLSTNNKIDIAATADGTDHLIKVAPDTTKLWTPEIVKWQAQVTDGTDIYNVGYGTLEIVLGMANATAKTDTRSQAKQTLDNIEAYLADSNNIQAASYTIAGRSLSRIGIPDLLKLRDRYRTDVANEEAAERLERGLPSRKQLRVRL